MSILNIRNHFLVIRLNLKKVDIKKGSLNFNVNLGVVSLFTNIPLDEAIKIQ